MKITLFREILMLGLTLVASERRGNMDQRALEELEKTQPLAERFFSRVKPSERSQDSPSPAVSGSTLAAVTRTPAANTPANLPYAQTSQPEYAGTSQLSAKGRACIPCGGDHLSAATGALSEAIRFARTSDITNPEVASRITLAMDELNAFERIDGAPEKVVHLSKVEKALMDEMLTASRDIRHHITDMQTPDDLERAAAIARQYRIEFIVKQLKLQRGINDG